MMEARQMCDDFQAQAPRGPTSFVSANLAAIVAQTGKRWCLIDGDMRKGYVHS